MEKTVNHYLVFDEGTHEYNLVVTKTQKKTIFELIYSDNEIWTLHTRNTTAMKIVDDGNDIILDKTYSKLNASEQANLRFLLNFELYLSPNEANRRKLKVIEAINVIEI
jgi:hypothetical protein